MSDDDRYEPAEDEYDLEEEMDNCGKYWDQQLKRWTCPNVGADYCAFPHSWCTGD
jgi:hypothetical protein